LDLSSKVSGDQRTEMRQTAERLISVLATFGVKAKLIQVTQGPAVTRYEIQPDTGVKLSKIVGLAEDLALNLAVSTVLVAPVPGKAAVGVEIPNNKVSTVSIREMLEDDAFRSAKSKLTVALGKDIGGNVVIGDIAKMPHVLIAGATGSGKSVCINTIVMSILYKAKPEEVKLIMIDPKVVELGVYNGIPHLLVPVVTDPKKAAGALNWAVTEMMRRYELFKDTGVRKLESYNKLMETTGGEKIPQLVVIIDELADLMMVAAKEVEDYVCRLAQLARAAGIHLIIATQRPSVDVITGLIKANIPSRIAFAVSSQVDSRTILDKGGAEKLLGMGDMLYHPSGARASTRVQGAFVSDPEIEKVLEFIKDNVGETHYSEDLAEEIERHATGESGVTPDVEDDGDALLPEAIELAVSLGKISTSMIQRRLGVGYSRAGRIIDQMEARGIISGANGSKPRDVLISHADLAVAEKEEYDEE
ncbi:MAG: DNA translocase FtsK, partial [Clostridia bacterium]|nr:DNA translocase FtsK [Clostridia bacterium]